MCSLCFEANPIETYQDLFCEGFGAPGCQTFGDLLFITSKHEDGIRKPFLPDYGVGSSLALVPEHATPLILTALSATVAFQSRDVQYRHGRSVDLGALAAVWLGRPDWSTRRRRTNKASEGLALGMHLTMPPSSSRAMIVGAAYSWIAGYLKVKLNVNELISTIILNAIAAQIVVYLVKFPLRSDPNNVARTQRIDDTALLLPFTRGILPHIDWFSGSRVGIGLPDRADRGGGGRLFSLAHHRRLRTAHDTGFAPVRPLRRRAQRAAALRAMLISGALSGLAGAIAILGVERRLVDGFAASGFGFEGVLVAILAKDRLSVFCWSRRCSPDWTGRDQPAIRQSAASVGRHHHLLHHPVQRDGRLSAQQFGADCVSAAC